MSAVFGQIINIQRVSFISLRQFHQVSLSRLSLFRVLLGILDQIKRLHHLVAHCFELLVSGRLFAH